MRPASLFRLALLALLWGSNFLLIRIALEGLSPTQIVLARMGLGAVVLLAYMGSRRQSLPRSPVLWAHLTVAAVVANIVPYYLFAWAEQYVPSNLAGVLNATTPLFVLALALALRHEQHLTIQRASGFALGFVGTFIILSPWRVVGFSQSLAAQIACLGAAASYAVAYIYQARFLARRGVTPVILAAGQLTAAAILLVLAAPFIAGGSVALPASVLGSVILLGAFGTGAAYILNYQLISDEGATSASIVTYLLPVVAVILGIALMNERLTWNLAIGALVVLAGVAISEGRLARSETAPNDSRANKPAGKPRPSS